MQLLFYLKILNFKFLIVKLLLTKSYYKVEPILTKKHGYVGILELKLTKTIVKWGY